MAKSELTQWRYYWYNPTLVGAIIFIVLFFLLVLVQTYQIIQSIRYIKKNGLRQESKISQKKRKQQKREEKELKQKWKNGTIDSVDQDLEKIDTEETHYGSYRFILILIPFYLGLYCEFIGYIGRTLNHDNIWERGPYIMQTLLLLIGSPLFSASIYMVFGRLVTNVLHNENYLLLYPKYITKFCVVGDIISLLLQAIGGSIMSATDKNIDNFKLGENVILGGLAVQILFFGFFVIIEATYFIRLHKNLNLNDYNSRVINHDLKKYPSKFNNWEGILLSLFMCSIFILIRSIYRVVEFTQGNNGYVARHEWFIYIFDSLMMYWNAYFFIAQNLSNYFLKTIPLTLEVSTAISSI